MTQRTFTRSPSFNTAGTWFPFAYALIELKLAITVSSLARVSRRNLRHWSYERQTFSPIARTSNLTKTPSMP